ncbi:MAG: glycosyltransferase, partial [Candidatus Gastranaerophilales bacterium]|nr:glycosyltransferase [Candidatus Gastranaerophilales bacterium]
MEEFLNLPKVSFIVITHNFSDFICDCLNSIKNQTYKNFEIIVVDDVSKDATREKISNYLKSNSKLDITFIKTENNIG